MATWYVATTGSDSNAGTSSGVPFATPGKAGSSHSGGDTILIAAGTYTLTNGTANTSGGPLQPKVGTSAAPTQVIGCNTSFVALDSVINYSGLPVFASSAAAGQAALNLTNDYCQVANLVIDGASQAARAAWSVGNNCAWTNCKALNGVSYGFQIDGSTTMERCLATANPVRGFTVNGPTILNDCVATANSGAGIFIDSIRIALTRCLIYANTGATTDGVYVQQRFGPWMLHCVLFNNGRDGIRLNDASSGDLTSIRGNIFYSNAGKAINSATTTYPVADCDYNAYASGALTGIPAGAHDVVLTGDPFTASGSGDFSLNNTAGAGAACRAAGFPGVLPLGLTTGYADIGVAQHQDTGGGGGGPIGTNFRGGFSNG